MEIENEYLSQDDIIAGFSPDEWNIFRQNNGYYLDWMEVK